MVFMPGPMPMQMIFMHNLAMPTQTGTGHYLFLSYLAGRMGLDDPSYDMCFEYISFTYQIEALTITRLYIHQIQVIDKMNMLLMM